MWSLVYFINAKCLWLYYQLKPNLSIGDLQNRMMWRFWQKKQFFLSVCILYSVCSLQSAFCTRAAVWSLQSAFCTDRRSLRKLRHACFVRVVQFLCGLLCMAEFILKKMNASFLRRCCLIWKRKQHTFGQANSKS